LLGVKSDHHFVADHQRGCRAALVFVHKIFDRLRVAADVTFFEIDSFLRKVAFGPCARWSARLRKQNYGLCHSLVGSANPLLGAVSYSITISKLISAVFFSIASTEQYFSIDSRTASSTDFRFT